MSLIPGSVRVTGFIAPSDSNDTYPSIDPLYGIDGKRSVANNTERNNISTARRRHGMEVFTRDSGKRWELQADLTTWNELVTTESDPVFTASEANLFVAGDKALLDSALQSESDPIFSAWLSTPPNISTFTNDSNYLTAAITSLNGLTTASQSFTIGAAGTTPAFNSVTATHTLDIPMASTALVTAGLISKTDYDSFASKQAGATNLTSLSGLTYTSASFVKMTAAGTFALDTNTYQIAGSYLAGSGTTNYIPKFTAGTTLGDSVISEVSGLIGINKATPTASLEIVGANTGSGANDYGLKISNSASEEIFSVRNDKKLMTDAQIIGLTTNTPLKFTNNNGWIQIGAQNSGACHIYTDRSHFYFNSNIKVATGVFTSADGTPTMLQVYGITGLAVKYFTGDIIRTGINTSNPTATLDIKESARVGITPTPTFLLERGAASTITLSTEVIAVKFNFNSVKQWDTGAITTQREVLFQQPTYSFIGASTITNAATFAIEGSPIAGTNATITNSMALWIQGGISKFDGNVGMLTSTFGTSSAGVFAQANGTAPTAPISTQYHQYCIGGIPKFMTGAGDVIVINKGAAVADASGGATIDTEARAAINALLARMRVTGGNGFLAD